MIQLSELTKSFGDRVLLDHVTWQIADGERVGLCGPNGAGKTTLLQDDGRARRARRRRDPQAVGADGRLPAAGRPDARRPHRVRGSSAARSASCSTCKAEMHDARAAAGRPGDPRSRARRDAAPATATCRTASACGDGYSIELKTATVLQGLGFKPADFDRPTETFSGGWQMRIALAKLLLGQPNLLLLDEPTNHLDLEARNWLEEYLERVSVRRHPRLARPLLPRRGRHAHRRSDAAHADRLRRQLQRLPRRARRAHRGAAQGEARAGRGSRARQDVHRPVPLPGDEGVAGAEPDQDAREGGADRGAARAQADPLRLSRPARRAAARCSS